MSLARLAFVFLILSALVSAMPLSARADIPAAAYRKAEVAAQAVVLVEYVLEKEGRGFGAVSQRADMVAVGTIVREDGLIALSTAIFPEDEDEEREPARPHTFVVRLADGKHVRARLLGRDRDRAVAFLQLEGTTRYPAITFDERKVALGEPVLVTELLPEKYKYAPSFRQASIGALLEKPRPLLDVDIGLQDGNVGAPVFDAQGDAIGLVLLDPLGESAGALSAPLRLIGTLSRTKAPGFPFVVPASELLPLFEAPPREDSSSPKERSWLGVTLQPVSRALAEHLGIEPPTGVMITSVWPASPAFEAGLQVEDVIVELAERPVEATSEDAVPAFIDRVQAMGAGKVVKLVVVRARERKAMTVKLGVAPTSAVRAEEYRSESFGLVAQNLTFDILMARGLPDDFTGALVSEMETAGWAQVGGLQRGDIIRAVNGEPVTNASDLKARLEAAEAARGPETVFFVLRDADTLFVPVTTPW